MESTFLQTAITASTTLKIVLRKGLEMSGAIQGIEKYDIECLIDGIVHTIPKKEIAYLRLEGQLMQPDATAEGESTEKDLQGTLLAGYRDQKKLVAVNLIGGGNQWGIISGFDPFTILLSHKSGQSLVYKHSITTVSEVRKNRAAGKNMASRKTEQQNVGEKPPRGPASTVPGE